MLTARSGKVLNAIVAEYIARPVPVASQVIAADARLGVSPATIRNEMAQLEHEGYLIRPHTSAGCIPSDKGYRHYVETMEAATLPPAEERLISHTFHQAERALETWLSLTATMLARLVQNMAVVSLPRSADSTLKHMELLSLNDKEALAVAVLQGARVKQKTLTFAQAVPQPTLTAASNKLNEAFTGLSGRQIAASKVALSPLEKQVADSLVEMMRAEGAPEYEEPYLDGWHFMLNQPEFARGEGMSHLMELAEQRSLLKVIVPEKLSQHAVHVVIGGENKEAAMRHCSVVISRYGLPEEASGTISVVGPTRLPYSHAMATVHYLSSVLTDLMAGLYGRDKTK